MEARDEIIRQTQAALLAERQRTESDLSGSPLQALFDAATEAERDIILSVMRDEHLSTFFHYEVCIQRLPLDTLAAILVAGCFCAVLSMLPAFYVDPFWWRQPLFFAALGCVGLSLLRLLAMFSLRKRYPTTYYTLKFITLTLMLALATVGITAYVFFWAGWWAVIYALALLVRVVVLLANPKTLTAIYGDIQKHSPEQPFDATMLLGGLLYLGVDYLGYIDLGLLDLPLLGGKLLLAATLALSLFLGWLLAGNVAFYALRAQIHLRNLLRKRRQTEVPAPRDGNEPSLLEQLRQFEELDPEMLADLSPEEQEVWLEVMREEAKEKEG